MVAVIVVSPTFWTVTVDPEIVATDKSLEVYETEEPELAVVGAGIVNEPTSNARVKLL